MPCSRRPATTRRPVVPVPPRTRTSATEGRRQLFDAAEDLGRGERAPVVAVTPDFAALDRDHGDVRQLVRLPRRHHDSRDGELDDDHGRVGGLVHRLGRDLADVEEVRVVAEVFADRVAAVQPGGVARTRERELEDAVLGPEPGEPGHVVREQPAECVLDEVSWLHGNSFETFGRYGTVPTSRLDGTVPSRPPARLRPMPRTPTGAAVLQPEVTQAITEAAMWELAEQGYGRLSMEAVAKRAGVGK